MASLLLSIPIARTGRQNLCWNKTLPQTSTCTTQSEFKPWIAKNTNVYLYAACKYKILVYEFFSLMLQLLLSTIAGIFPLLVASVSASLYQRQNCLQKPPKFSANIAPQSLNIINMTEFDYLLKFIIIGDTGVGKSCIVTQFIQQKMSIQHQVTLGVQFASRIINLNNKYVKLQVWDTAGQQNFRSITRSYYRSAIGALLIYDITKKKSFQHLKDWIKQIKNNGSQKIQILLLGNKSDLQTHRQVTATQGRKFADQNGLQWLQISAKDYPKVQTAFLKLTRQIINMIEKGQINQTTPGVKINQSQKIDPIRDGGFTRRHCC